MSKGKTKPVISRLRQSNWSKAFLFLLIVNFINLSANFYEGNILISGAVSMEDPVDTLSELIFEWALDGGDDLIPDNGTKQDDNSLEKIKLAVLEIPGFQLDNPGSELDLNHFPEVYRIILGHFSICTPPPDRC
jgi:hypothetical protein